MSADVLASAVASTAGVLGHLKPEHLANSTPCEAWTVQQVLNHLVGSAAFFAAIAEGAPPPAEEGDIAAQDALARFTQAGERAVAAFRAPGAMDQPMAMPFGEVPGSVCVMIAATDVYGHGWDLAKATGVSTDLDPRVAEAILAVAGIPDAFRGAGGPFGPVIEVPASACAADRLAGYLGRRP